MAEESLGKAVLTLSTDSKAYNKGLEDAADKQGKLKNEIGDTSGIAKAFGASFAGAIAGVAAAFTAAAIKDTLIGIGQGIVDLGIRGATVSDISAQFGVLNQAIGNNAQTLSTTLNAAFKGTISNFDAMQASNKALSAGLKLNEDQFGLTARASRVLADRIGGDTKDAYASLLEAMASGKDAALKQIGINIDGAAAVDKFAASLGVEASELTESATIAAKKSAILAELERVLAVSGDAEVDFADRVDQAKVALANLMDGIGQGIAESPVLAAAMGSFADSFAAAFGPNQKGLVDLVVKAIEFIAEALIDAGLFAVEFTRIGAQAFGYLMTPIRALVVGLTTISDAFADAVATTAGLAAGLPGVGTAFDGVAAKAAAMAAQTEQTKQGAQGLLDSSLNLAAGQGALFTGLDKISGVLINAKASMVAASLAQDVATTSAAATTEATKGLAAGYENLGTSALKAAKASKESAGIIHGDGMTMVLLMDILTAETEEMSRRGNLALDKVFDFQKYELGLDTFTHRLTNTFNLANQNFHELRTTVYETEPKVTGFFGNVFGDAKSFGSNLSGIFQSAFTGGGGALGAVKSFATGTLSTMLGMIPGVGPFISGFAGPIVGMFGKLASKAKDFFSSLFGGPSADEKKGRETVAALEAEVMGVISAQGKAAAGGERWKEIVISVTEQYAAVGLSSEQALADVEALWASSKDGAEASAAAAQLIRDRIAGTATEAVDGVNAVKRAIAGLPDEIDIEANIHVNVETDRGREDEGEGEGYARGTLGRHGSYFADFKRATRTVLHGREAVITEGQAVPFARDVLGLAPSGAAASPTAGGGGTDLQAAIAGMGAELGALSRRLVAQQQQQQLTLAVAIRDAVHGRV